ncbi:hypothetical protein SUSAZ_04925 [Sulfolobus acidocaldarius SUSAZ]|nr:hypothetical protein SUSAZ_04925 [Sulfolobus acidocaldarius SUSAZ]
MNICERGYYTVFNYTSRLQFCPSLTRMQYYKLILPFTVNSVEIFDITEGKKKVEAQIGDNRFVEVLGAPLNPNIKTHIISVKCRRVKDNRVFSLKFRIDIIPNTTLLTSSLFNSNSECLLSIFLTRHPMEESKKYYLNDYELPRFNLYLQRGIKEILQEQVDNYLFVVPEVNDYKLIYGYNPDFGFLPIPTMLTDVEILRIGVNDSSKNNETSYFANVHLLPGENLKGYIRYDYYINKKFLDNLPNSIVKLYVDSLLSEVETKKPKLRLRESLRLLMNPNNYESDYVNLESNNLTFRQGDVIFTKINPEEIIQNTFDELHFLLSNLDVKLFSRMYRSIFWFYEKELLKSYYGTSGIDKNIQSAFETGKEGIEEISKFIPLNSLVNFISTSYNENISILLEHIEQLRTRKAHETIALIFSLLIYINNLMRNKKIDFSSEGTSQVDRGINVLGLNHLLEGKIIAILPFITSDPMSFAIFHTRDNEFSKINGIDKAGYSLLPIQLTQIILFEPPLKIAHREHKDITVIGEKGRIYSLIAKITEMVILNRGFNSRIAYGYRDFRETLRVRSILR